MNNVRTVLAKHKAYKRARRLWEEYLEVSELRDKVEADQKLSTFLDNFKQSYEELSSGPRAETMDSIFGECTDILQSLLALLDKKTAKQGGGETNLADLVNNVLEVAELLIRCGAPRWNAPPPSARLPRPRSERSCAWAETRSTGRWSRTRRLCCRRSWTCSPLPAIRRPRRSCCA